MHCSLLDIELSSFTITVKSTIVIYIITLAINMQAYDNFSVCACGHFKVSHMHYNDTGMQLLARCMCAVC